jgi:hypothetical protein
MRLNLTKYGVMEWTDFSRHSAEAKGRIFGNSNQNLTPPPQKKLWNALNI